MQAANHSAEPRVPLVLYRSPLSGHAHRAELFLSLLGLQYRLVDVDLRGGEQHREPFLRLNPFGQVPVLDDNGVVLGDSNAILVYLATRYDDGRWLPRDPVGAARVQRWLSVAAGEIAFGPAAARLGVLFGRPVPLDDAIARTEDEIKLIREYRDRLIADVVTGQVDVRGWQPGPDDVVDDAALAALDDENEDVTEEEDGDGED